ncbi:MAG: hypothetical protein QOJ07_2790 [Thermoleophilaceae bacterium]|nr:hypothetical protein [Thermoleophilaceae bacterium]
MARLRHSLGRALSLLLIPASIVPLVLVAPQIAESYRLFDRNHNSGPFAPPAIRLTAAQRNRFRPLQPYSGVVPVLDYGEVTDDSGAGSLAVTRHAFAEQMAALRNMGFRSIDVGQYLRMRRGDTRGLPERPILITFDGGRLASYRGADRVLQRYGFRATMFVAAERISAPLGESEDFLTWRELHTMTKSGRWDVQPMADRGYRRVAVDARGDTAPFFAARRFTRSAGLETFAAYDRRVTQDVFGAQAGLAQHGYDAHAFAVPEGDLGQLTPGDPRIAPFMRELLSRQFGVYFTRDPRNDPAYAGAGVEAQRYVVGSATTTDRLYMWLRDHSPAQLAAAARRRSDRLAVARRHAHERRAAAQRADDRRKARAKHRAKHRAKRKH